jgi:hypothetical protein
MGDLSFAIVVASLHGRTGKTLLTRVVAEYFLLSNEQPFVFDTDPVDLGLRTLLPGTVQVVDLAHVPQQMTLFDTMVEASPQSRIVDLTHRSFTRFFELMQQTDFIREARANRIEPVIFYIPDHRRDSFEAGVRLRRRFPDCAMVVVENAYLRTPREVMRENDAYRALNAHDLRLGLPLLAPETAERLEEAAPSLGDLLRRPHSYAETARLPEPERQLAAQLRSWLITLMQEIHRVRLEVAGRAGARTAAAACI